MSKKNKRLRLIVSIILFLMIICIRGIVKAASMSISVSKSSANVGETVDVTVSSSCTGRVNLSAPGGELSASKVWLEGNSQTVQLTSNSASTITITATAEGGTLSNNGSDEDVSEQYTKVTFKEGSSSTSNNGSGSETTTSKSNNANLKNLGITPNDFSGFKANNTTYNVTVPNNVEQVKVYATAQDSKATVTGTGNQKLKVGTNVLNVVVKAEDGTNKTYTINVTRKEESETTEETSNQTEDENTSENEEESSSEKQENINSAVDLVKLAIDGYTLTPEFSADVYEYELNINGNLTELNVIAEGANHNVEIEIVGNKDLQEGENVITILVHNQETGIYSTYQIMVNKTNIDLESLNTTLNDAIKKANLVRTIIIGILIFIVLVIIVFIVMKQKYKNIKQEKIDLNEEKDLFESVNQENNKEEETEDYKVPVTHDINKFYEETEKTEELNNTKPRKSNKKGRHF